MQPVTSFSSSPLQESTSPSQEGKRYVRDYPDSDRRVDEYGRIFVKDSEGYELVVSREIQDRLVIEDFSETRLQKLARRCAFMEYPTQEEWRFRGQMVEEFGKEETESAIQKVFDERHNLYSPTTRALSELGMQFIEVKRKVDQWNEENTYIGEDGLRHSKILPRATFFDVVKEVGRGISRSYTSLQRNHPTAVLAVKVSAFALALFFLRTRRSSSEPLFL